MNDQHIPWIILGIFTIILVLPALFRPVAKQAGPSATLQTVSAGQLLESFKSTEALEIEVFIDARDLNRGLLHSELLIPVKPGPMTLWFPKWIPGIHAPRGAIQNLAGLMIYNSHGELIPWTRDNYELFRFQFHVPPGTERIKVQFDYVCNQPSTNSTGVDSFGDQFHGVISWNNILMYPDQYSDDAITIKARLSLPSQWELFSALDSHIDNQEYIFDTCNLSTCIDSPIICGSIHSSHQLNSNGKDVFVHSVGVSKNSIDWPKESIVGLKNLVNEARALFGHEHYKAYHFLLVCSNRFPHLGLEHLESSLNGVNATDLGNGADGATRVMSHEYVHSWCGKYRRPLGMYTDTYHREKDTTLLWIYEGLTQYLGNVLAVRANLRSEADFHDMLRYYVSNLRATNGRRWRSLADTATSSYLLRGGSDNWPSWVRGQDYYIEGALVWLEADSIIRNLSNGTRSLDDFCKVFLGKQDSDLAINPYSYNDVIHILNQIQPYSWADFFEKRIYQTQDSYNTDFFEDCGWKFSLSTTPDSQGADISSYYRNAFDSIGVGFSSNGRVYRVLVDSPGFQAGLGRGMHVTRINDKSFSGNALHQALIDASNNKPLVFTINNGEQTFHQTIDYKLGPQYLVLERIAGSEDLLLQIIKPQSSLDSEQVSVESP